MRLQRIVSALLTVGLLVFPLSASAKIMRVSGVGSEYCADFLAASQNSQIGVSSSIELHQKIWLDKKTSFFEWAYGFIAAAVIHDRESSNSLSPAVFDAWITKYCNDHLSDTYMNAVMQYLVFAKIKLNIPKDLDEK